MKWTTSEIYLKKIKKLGQFSDVVTTSFRRAFEFKNFLDREIIINCYITDMERFAASSDDERADCSPKFVCQCNSNAIIALLREGTYLAFSLVFGLNTYR